MSVIKQALTRWGRLMGVGCACVAGVVATGCGTPSASVSNSSVGAVPSLEEAAKQVAKEGKFTLTVVDQEGDATGTAEYKALNKGFEAKYPNIKIHRILRDDSLFQQLPLLLSGGNAPDVTESDQGYATQGRLVKAGLILPLDAYAKAWGWEQRQPATQLIGQRVLTDGTHLGSGKLYGMAPSSSLVGIYYNAKLLAKLGATPPKTRAQFEELLAKAKAAGIVPIEGGDSESGDVVGWGFIIASAMNMPASEVQETMLGKAGATFDKPGFLAAAEQVASWAKKGYVESGFEGINPQQAAANFSKGQGLFFIDGTWWAGNVQEGLGSNGRFMLPPSPSGEGGAQSAVDAANQPWVIPTKSSHRLAAALYINFITEEANTSVFLKNSDIPGTKFDESQTASLPQLSKDLLTSASYLREHGTGLPFGWAIPTTYTWLTSSGEGLVNGKLTPKQFITELDAQLSQDQAQYQK